jgi:hypothetical protein
VRDELRGLQGEQEVLRRPLAPDLHRFARRSPVKRRVFLGGGEDRGGGDNVAVTEGLVIFVFFHAHLLDGPFSWRRHLHSSK